MTPPDEQLDARYHQLIDRLPATVAVWDRNSRVVSFVSQQIETLTGAPAETWVGHEGMERFRSRVHPDDLADPERWREPDDPLPSQYRWTRPDGRMIWIRELLSPISGPDVQAILFDVTAEVEAALELADQRQRYETLIQQLPVATFIMDAEGTPVYASPQLEQILGRSMDELLAKGSAREGRRLWFHPDDYEWTLAEALKVYDGLSDGYNFQARLIHADGSIRHVRVISRAIKDEHDRLVATQGVVIDITDEMDARAERDEHLLRYRTLIEQTPVVTYQTDRAGVITYISPQIEQMLGYTPERLVHGMDESQRRPLIFHPDSLELVGDKQQAMLEGKVAGVDEAATMVASDGSKRYVQIIARTMHDPDGGLTGTQGVIVDLTELRLARQRSLDVLGALVTAAEDERARIATELHDDTVQVMTALLMHVRMLMRKDAGLERFEQLLSEALDRTRRLMFELRPHVLERSGLGAAIDELAGDGPWQRAEVRIEIPRQSDTLEAVAYRAIRELIINARKHSQASLLSITGWRDEEALHFLVEDDGVGFDVARALDRDRMRMHIGLDATAERINLAGGSLQIDSAPGAGARFSLMLPEQPREAPVTVPNGADDET
jgi:PAS domain S-box-containing protein